MVYLYPEPNTIYDKDVSLVVHCYCCRHHKSVFRLKVTNQVSLLLISNIDRQVSFSPFREIRGITN